MPEPTADLQAVRAATAELLADLAAAGWTDADVAAPSLCAGWTRGHVLTHLARNADGIAATLAGALRGEIVPRYASWDARGADIEAGAGRPFGTLVADVRDSAERLDRVLMAVGDRDAWDRPTDNDRTAGLWPTQRLWEVAIHHVDLDAGHPASTWPTRVIEPVLIRAVDGLAERTNRSLVVIVDAADSVVPGLAGRTWSVPGEGTPTEVRGPDWALAAWLTGRPSATCGRLSAVPDLTGWR